jgi:hypothetical protein
MSQESILEKLKNAPVASFHVLETKKAKRMNAKTMFIPAPEDVAKVIAAVPVGQTRTILELRHALARLGNAETACPAKTIKYWKWLAQATNEAKDSSYAVPWWRVLKDGKPSPHMPGGIERQMAILKAEGVLVNW